MKQILIILLLISNVGFSQLDDATKHMVVSHTISTTIGVTVYEITENPVKAIITSFIITNIIGFGKEFHDKKTTGFSWRDIGNNNWGIGISTITLIPYTDRRQKDKAKVNYLKSKFNQYGN